MKLTPEEDRIAREAWMRAKRKEAAIKHLLDGLGIDYEPHTVRWLRELREKKSKEQPPTT